MSAGRRNYSGRRREDYGVVQWEGLLVIGVIVAIAAVAAYVFLRRVVSSEPVSPIHTSYYSGALPKLNFDDTPPEMARPRPSHVANVSGLGPIAPRRVLPGPPRFQPSSVGGDETPGRSTEVHTPVVPRNDNALAGLVMDIEYQKEGEDPEFRRIRIKSIHEKAGMTYIEAYCYLRRAPRNFRYDRIVSIADDNGEVHDPDTYFEALLGYPLRYASASTVPTTEPIQKPHDHWFEYLQSAIDGVSLLIALGRADIRLVKAERSIIVQYIRSIAESEGKEWNLGSEARIDDYLKRLKPDEQVVRRSISRLQASGEFERQTFLDHAERLIHADGRIHPAEEAMLREMRAIIHLQ